MPPAFWEKRLHPCVCLWLGCGSVSNSVLTANSPARWPASPHAHWPIMLTTQGFTSTFPSPSLLLMPGLVVPLSPDSFILYLQSQVGE